MKQAGDLWGSPACHISIQEDGFYLFSAPFSASLRSF